MIVHSDLLNSSISHMLAVHETLGYKIKNYNNELLLLAQDLGNRLLPAFDTPTGIPWPRVSPGIAYNYYNY